MKFKIGDVEIKNGIILAPMAGVSNYPFMKICEEMGVSYVVTELISAEAVVRGNDKTFEMLKGLDKLSIPVGVQIFGSKPEVMAKAAKELYDRFGFKIVDINMGCPVPKVAVKSGAGSALLKEPERLRMIVKAVVEAVPIPVTVKIRSGWDSESVNAVEVAKICEEAGASAIAIHGRTRSQGYGGSVNLDIIKKVKEAVNIPVIGNGDVTDTKSAREMISVTGVDGIMVGRGALGNPWLIRDLVGYFETGLEPTEVTARMKIEMCFHHLDYLLEVKDERIAVLEMRSHVSWYLKGLNNCIEVKKRCFQAKTLEELKEILVNYLIMLEN